MISVEQRRVILHPGESGYWVIECLSLPACVSQGKTREEAIASIREAMALYIEFLRDRSEPILEDRDESFIVAA